MGDENSMEHSSHSGQNGKSSQQIIVVSPDMLIRLGIADQLKALQPNIKTSNRFNVVTQVKSSNNENISHVVDIPAAAHVPNSCQKLQQDKDKKAIASPTFNLPRKWSECSVLLTKDIMPSDPCQGNNLHKYKQSQETHLVKNSASAKPPECSQEGKIHSSKTDTKTLHVPKHVQEKVPQSNRNTAKILSTTKASREKKPQSNNNVVKTSARTRPSQEPKPQQNSDVPQTSTSTESSQTKKPHQNSKTTQATTTRRSERQKSRKKQDYSKMDKYFNERPVTDKLNSYSTNKTESIVPSTDVSPELPSISHEIDKDQSVVPATDSLPLVPANGCIEFENNFVTSSTPQKLEKNIISKEKKRGRKKKDVPTPQNDETTDATPSVEDPASHRRGRPRKPDINEKTLPVQTVPVTKSPTAFKTETSDARRRRKAPNKPDEIDGKGLSDDSTENEEEDEEFTPPPRRINSTRGRSSGRAAAPIDHDYTQKVPPVIKKPQKVQEVTKQNSEASEVTCGKCLEKIKSNQWSGHNLSKHNNMAWKEGDPVPNYLENLKLWRKVLFTAFKKKKKMLMCDKCETTKRSVDGFISHYQFCGKTAEEQEAMKWICPLCSRVFMPSSREFHERMHRDEAKVKKNYDESTQLTPGSTKPPGPRKRKAAEKAATKIHEFTKLVKESDEPPTKRTKLKKVENISNFIDYPQKAVPNIWKGLWTKSIADNKKASCRHIGCSFETTTLEKMYEHIQDCKYIPQKFFTCKICKYKSTSLNDVEEHVEKTHSNDLVADEEDSDFQASDSSEASDDDVPENEERQKLTTFNYQGWQTKYEQRPLFLKNQPRYRESQVTMTWPPALRWTLAFEVENYRLRLFKNFKPNHIELLTNAEAKQYLPISEESMRIRDRKDNEDWKTFKLFESSMVNSNVTFFVGGPVWAMAWLPIPASKFNSNVDQYLAISTHKSFEDSYSVGRSYKLKNVIQIWNMGNLNHETHFTPRLPRLAYAIAHDKGTIWCMQWCPSGTYEDENLIKSLNIENFSGRMGLLAIASSDGYIHIYSLPFPDTLEFIESCESTLPIYKTNPIITLRVSEQLQNQDKVNWQCLNLCWSKLFGHTTIAAGLSNGYVALWNLDTKSPLLIKQVENTLFINAFEHFYAHGQGVTYVEIIPLSGQRFLATAGLDRYIKYWDLENLSYPQKMIKKGAVVNGAWLTHWSTIFTSYDDVFSLAQTVTYMNGLRDPTNKTFPLLPTNSTTYGLAASDYANGICHGTLAGEIVAIFPFQLLYVRDLDKLPRKRWLLSSTEVIDLQNTSNESSNEKKESDDDYIYQPDNYSECKDRYGIVFHNHLDYLRGAFNRRKKENSRATLNSALMTPVPVERYQFTSINRIAWNPNTWSYLWIAAGYQSGLIRMIRFESMSMQNSIVKLLPEHVNNVMAREKINKITT